MRRLYTITYFKRNLTGSPLYDDYCFEQLQQHILYHFIAVFETIDLHTSIYLYARVIRRSAASVARRTSNLAALRHLTAPGASF